MNKPLQFTQDYNTYPINKLIKPEFDIKKNITGIDKMKLQACIKLAGYGIICTSGSEVIDGWKRVEIIKECNLYTEVDVLDYGKISIAKKVLLRRILNHQWSDIDAIELSKMLKNEVLKEFSIIKLSNYFPEDQHIIKELSTLIDFDWKDFDKHHPDTVMKKFSFGEE